MAGSRALPSRSDVVLAVLVLVAIEGELFTSWAFEHTGRTGPGPIHLVTPVLVSGILVWRRTQPLAVCLAISAVLAAESQLSVWPNTYSQIVAFGIATFALVVHERSAATAVAGLVASQVVMIPVGLSDDQDPIGSTITGFLLAAGIAVAGALVRRQRHRTARAEHSRMAAEAHAARVAEEERAEIARELHDVVAHGMSVVLLQARGGRKRLADEPATARAAFDTIERVTADCLEEMRRLVGMLRTPGTDAPLAPQPRLSDLDALVSRLCSAGARVEFTTAGEARELAAYRIAQESLTNTVKHAPDARARLHLRYEPDAVAIDVIDDGPGKGSQGDGQGHGLIGMQQRVAVFGGSFSAGHQAEGGFRVSARIPTQHADLVVTP